MNGTSVILKKELKRVFGDKKLVFSLFVLPALIVIVIYGFMGFMIKSMIDDVTSHQSIVTLVNAPSGIEELVKATGYAEAAEITYMNQNEYDEAQEELKTDILEGRIDLAVVFDENFDEVYGAYEKAGDKSPNINFLYNSTEDYSSQAYSTFMGMMLEPFRTTLIANRIGNMEMLTVFTQNDEIIAKESKMNNEFVSMMLPYLIVMLLFAGAMSVGIDAIAGEKERGTLASMLISPVKRIEIVFGKLFSLCILSGISAVTYCISMIIAMGFMGGMMDSVDESGFGNISLGPVEYLELLAIMLVMVYMFVALISTLCIYAKDTKVAGSYVSPFYIVVIVAGMMTMFSTGSDIPAYKYMIPVYGNALAIKDLCSNELATGNFLACLVGTLIVGILCTFAMVKAFNSEKVMFNA